MNGTLHLRDLEGAPAFVFDSRSPISFRALTNVAFMSDDASQAEVTLHNLSAQARSLGAALTSDVSFGRQVLEERRPHASVSENRNFPPLIVVAGVAELNCPDGYVLAGMGRFSDVHVWTHSHSTQPLPPGLGPNLAKLRLSEDGRVQSLLWSAELSFTASSAR